MTLYRALVTRVIGGPLIATAKVGGVRFVRIGRLAISICVVRRGRSHSRRVQPSRVTVPCTITLMPKHEYTTGVRPCE